LSLSARSCGGSSISERAGRVRSSSAANPQKADLKVGLYGITPSSRGQAIAHP
jgi:hypothetical protein